MSETKKSTLHTHDIFHVRGEAKDAYWSKIGRAWMHKDQGGLTLDLEFVPTNFDGRLVARVRKEEAAQ